jgi:alpha-galactosidase
VARIKIGVIGAGSVAWSSTLIHDLLHMPTLYGSKVYLMDINEERLRLLRGFAERYMSEIGGSYEFITTTDRLEAIRDADIVVNTAMYGGHQYYEEMRRISEKHGYYRGVNSTEWNMVSDYHTIWGYYQWKLAMDIAWETEEYAPNAWLIQLANPVFELTTLIARETRARVIGLCHGHLGYREIAHTIGLDPDKVDYEAIGFNHVIWLTRFRYNGEDAYPLIDKWIEEKAEKYWQEWRKTQVNPFDIQMSPAAVDMYRRYGLFPVGDTVRGGTWMYHWDLETKKQWFGPTGGPDSEIGWEMRLKLKEAFIEDIKEALKNNSPLAPLFPKGLSGEPVVPLIDTLIRDVPRIHQVNVLNMGAIEGLPDSIAVEIPATVDGKGVKRPQGLRLPGRIMKLVLWPRMLRAEMAIEGFLEGGFQVLVDWLMLDPRTKSEKQAEQAWQEILSMPGNEEMKKHYR